MLFAIRLTRNLAYIAALSLTAACAPSSYLIKEPTPSGIRYEALNQTGVDQLLFLDERRGDDQTFSSGVLPATLTLASGPVNAPQFLAKLVGEELKSRGLSVDARLGEGGAPRVHLKNFHVQNHRASAYSPFFTFTYISADLETASGMQRIGVYVRRGKVPVWSFDEVVEPVFNQPLSIAVKEFSSKIANKLYGYRADDQTVKQLLTKVSGARTPDTFLDVYSLGFTNNPLAIPTLVELAQDNDEYVRQAAISSLGTIGATAQLSLLRSIYEKPNASLQDRSMAIKAIADLGTPETKEFVAAELKRLSSQTDSDALWTTRVLALYL